jgi:hypothetical protein
MAMAVLKGFFGGRGVSGIALEQDFAAQSIEIGVG